MKINFSFFFIFLSFFLFFLSEIVFPFIEAINFDVFENVKKINYLRKERNNYQKEIKKIKRLVRLKKEEFFLIKKEEEEDEEYYCVIDLFSQRLYLKKGARIVQEFRISGGSGKILTGPFGKKWQFVTPKGVLRVLRKIKDPIWYKPDWAFIEEKKPIPPKNSPLRRVKGMLGEYALDLGGGILIHGTPYEHLLGRPVSHGCIRVEKEGIKMLYDSLKLGAKVYIYGK
ncbi:MAG: L,D-transpeptidase [candidate division WOR-3 bacterium]|nr:L,D-transpeptidase [candidate division WOR-3 bacterium]MCX7837193.1 L,D-transpeptidase [candidate division WOR-3 bacterium]MDW8113959.1 L,D-transpeptidase [candidate division WOR-3 bacterium]